MTRDPRPSTLVLWDVDQTLVDYSGTGHQWYGQALTAVCGVEIAHVPSFPGRTERSITLELLEAHGVDWTEDHVRRMYAELVAIANAARADLAALGSALPGSIEVLRGLAERSDVVQSLVTGNLLELAECKLAPFGLGRYVDFAIGGYGSVSADRHELVSAAVEAAETKHDTRFTRVVVIGDTPHDVAAAHHYGAVAAGVATGRYTVEDLTACGADLVFTDLSDTDAVLTALTGRVEDQLPSGA
ncbi:haloacid dehalogenase-like hydrolase [Actinokineospora auranticolor]|uniref:Phosphoglycolate phosphatase-like HAD superfamily hydrolase n=1 Tax=Actinokineospora auranticolor TaxID=155976 RepID=A0A2S6GQ70_9PSEU|nr:haloacid dehalogenase-like hydrolase [Actinokineospora auranticolor]PPK67412.1 phosphoglycolate phosphatase-like HAD superfamily hydrolase [Actinokineospora auranticolor]